MINQRKDGIYLLQYEALAVIDDKNISARPHSQLFELIEKYPNLDIIDRRKQDTQLNEVLNAFAGYGHNRVSLIGPIAE